MVEEFYADEVTESGLIQSDSKAKTRPKFNQGNGFVQDIQQGLQGSVWTN